MQPVKEIEEVVFSGGDPLMAKDHELDWLIQRLEKNTSFTGIAYSYCLPIVIPQRITNYFCQILKAGLKSF